MTGPVIHIDDAEGFEMSGGDGATFAAHVAPIGEPLGSTGLGAMYVTVQPGKRAFPFHNHLAMDEMFVILEGSGTYRYGDSTYPVRAGSVCAAPKGGPDTAHQLINTGDSPLKYLGVSTLPDPDVVQYPDSDKYSVLAIAPGTDFFNAHLKAIHRAEDALDYWEGEL